MGLKNRGQVAMKLVFENAVLSCSIYKTSLLFEATFRPRHVKLLSSV